MVLVVEIKTNKILAKFEAWDEDSIDNAIKWAEDNGYDVLAEKITPMGDMVILVK